MSRRALWARELFTSFRLLKRAFRASGLKKQKKGKYRFGGLPQTIGRITKRENAPKPYLSEKFLLFCQTTLRNSAALAHDAPKRRCINRGSNTTTTTMVAMTTDVTTITNDHAWTDNHDLTNQRLQNNPILEHPSEHPGLNIFGQIFRIFWGRPKSVFFLFFPVSDPRPEIPVLAGGRAGLQS